MKVDLDTLERLARSCIYSETGKSHPNAEPQPGVWHDTDECLVCYGDDSTLEVASCMNAEAAAFIAAADPATVLALVARVRRVEKALSKIATRTRETKVENALDAMDDKDVNYALCECIYQSRAALDSTRDNWEDDVSDEAERSLHRIAWDLSAEAGAPPSEPVDDDAMVTLDQATKSLDRYMRDVGFIPVAMGVNAKRQTIYVYITEPAHEVPNEWCGYPVVVKKTGRPVPADGGKEADRG